MTTILWLHGFPLSARIFDRQHAIDATHVMPNLPGFGGAPPPAGETTMESYARDVLAITPGKVIVAGFSMGGYVAFEVARLAPERIAGLILIDTRETADTDEARKGRYDSIEKVRAEGVRPIVEGMLPKMLTKSAPPELVEEVRSIMSKSSPEGVMAALRAMGERRDSTDLLPTLNVPALVIVGEEDPITPPSDAERIAGLLPKSRLVKIANAAHLSNVEQSDAVNRAVTSWLQENQR